MREKEIKKWRREKKDCLVNVKNPQWQDLSVDVQDSSLRSE
jgi:putative endonuclease